MVCKDHVSIYSLQRRDLQPTSSKMSFFVPTCHCAYRLEIVHEPTCNMYRRTGPNHDGLIDLSVFDQFLPDGLPPLGDDLETPQSLESADFATSAVTDKAMDEEVGIFYLFLR